MNDIVRALQKKVNKLRREAPIGMSETIEKEWFSRIEDAKSSLNTAIAYHISKIEKKERRNAKANSVSEDEVAPGLPPADEKGS